jgi:hypothetical protein
MAGIFINASTARTNTRNNVVVHGEITAIESAVFANVEQGVLYAVVNNTVMTNSNVYYYVWNNITTDPTKLDQLNYVKNYFNNLGYGISLVSDPGTTDTLQWNISW